MTEEWRPVVGHEGIYEISSIGRLRRIAPGPGTKPGRIVRGTTNNQHGYHIYVLSWQGVKVPSRAHRLVALAFLGPAPEGMIVCHNNGIKTDNRVENLRWDTDSANKLDVVRHGDNPQRQKTHCPRQHPLTPDNVYADKHGWRRCKRCHIEWGVAYVRRKRADAGRVFLEQVSA